jgi:hypothetical protein
MLIYEILRGYNPQYEVQDKRREGKWLKKKLAR